MLVLPGEGLAGGQHTKYPRRKVGPVGIHFDDNHHLLVVVDGAAEFVGRICDPESHKHLR